MSDWRIDNCKHLRGLTLERQKWVRWSEDWDHDHCAACWAKFMEGDALELKKEGYATRSDYKKGLDMILGVRRMLL